MQSDKYKALNLRCTELTTKTKRDEKGKNMDDGINVRFITNRSHKQR